MFALLTLPAFAETRAWLDRDAIGRDETTTLNIQTDQASVTTPDYAPLYADFEVTGSTSSRQFERINGQNRIRVLFAVALRPLRDGVLELPPLRVGGESTAPQRLTVQSSAQAPTRAGGPVFIESQLDAQAPYVQQAVGYVVRLYYATSLISGQLDQDEPEGASLQKVGEDLQYTRDLGGRRYNVVERRFLLVPERSGQVTVPGARFQGQGVGGFFDDLFGDGRRALDARGSPRSFNVRAIPANAPQPWLPLRALTLRYLSAPQAARLGAAASLTVEAVVDGASATQLPELQLPAPAGAQVFADPQQVTESFEQGRPQVRVVRKFSLVPARAGALRIPGPRMAWWDVAAGSAREATLPDINLDVAPGPGGQGAATAPAPGAVTPRGQGWMRVPFVQGAVHPWALATVAFALLWLVTLWWGLRRRSAAATAPAAAVNPPPATSSVPARADPGLKTALAGGDLGTIANALRASAVPPAADLDAVRERLADDAQRAAVTALQQARWGNGNTATTLAQLRDAFKRAPQWRGAAKREKELLPPLYPRRD